MTNSLNYVLAFNITKYFLKIIRFHNDPGEIKWVNEQNKIIKLIFQSNKMMTYDY